MDKGTKENTVIRNRTVGAIVVVALAAVVMGAPTLQGTFVGGDDHRLVLDHVLVNHPSIAHAIELFKIVHRDLYQPLPLLSFQAEFAVAGLLGLFDENLEGGAWLFHLTNVLLHAINAVLVWVVVRSLHRREHARLAEPIAIVAAVLFAIHPLEVEVVAWVNGRMMLLSTLFALASLATLARWLDDRRYGWALLTLLLATCCAISKIRVCLPVLMLIVLLAQRRKPTVQFMLLWISCTAVTAVFGWVNYQATAEAGMFSGAAHNLQGPKIVRALLALAWYFQHFVWPSGLASWYATPAVVSWSDGTTVRALAIVVPVLIVAGWYARHSRAAALSFAWFFVAMASTIQLVPTRNALAADRYMYLPITGLLWFMASFFCGAYERLRTRGPVRRTRIAAGVLGAAVVAAMIAQSWHVASFYNSSVDKSRRIAELYPDVPHVWERAAWACYRAEYYAQAIALAERELVHDDRNVRSDAHAVIGMSQFRMGQQDIAFESLRRAIEIDPQNSQVKYHFAQILAEAGHIDDAIRLLEESIEAAPLANPRILRLAALYRQVGRPEDARQLYEQALRNNPYDVPATMGLTELNLETGTKEAYQDAARRLGTMLEWMPENAAAWVNLGVVRKALGQTGPAIRAYREALVHDPQHLTAALNLAMLYEGLGDSARAAPLFERAAVLGVGSVEEMV
ncbi:MAG: tetratricopeptide repeat protein, partial [Planctomycetes bacterium]|nr:tetratricopeptide repeat protein [Planctomycetota bacterium]